MRLFLLAALSLSLTACPATDAGIDDTDPEDADADADGISASEGDCDDTNPSVNPEAAEVCDEADNDCDTEIDEGVLLTWYADADGDSFGEVLATLTACTAPAGYVADGTDCDDTSASFNPSAAEDDCTDPADYNCDGTVAYADADADGSAACEDCDDAAAAVNPAATETCNGVDDDCDSVTDEPDAVGATTWYADTDGDGFGALGVTSVACDAPLGYVADATDCDDASGTVRPGAVEECNEIDDNCDGTVDEGACDTCTLTGVGTPTDVVRSGATYGAWFVDPLETLGEGLVWEMDNHTGSSLVEYADEAAMVARVATSTTTLPYSFDGTGAAVYDGFLYYNAAATANLVKYDISTGESSLLELPSAGFRNTYAYQWGGWSDIDVAADEQGLWVIYATAENGGRIVISKIDEALFTIIDTWNTSSDTKGSLGNAWMMCGVLYTTNDYYSSPTTVNYAFDTSDESSSFPGYEFTNPHGYNSSINYNPTDGLLRSWDNAYRQTYPTTAE